MQSDSRYYTRVKRVGTISGLRVYGATDARVEPVVRVDKTAARVRSQSDKLTASITKLNLEGGK